MRRRSLLLGLGGGVLALSGCDAKVSPQSPSAANNPPPELPGGLPGPSQSVPTPYVSPTPILIRGRAAVAADYQWFTKETDLVDGYCFTWVQDLTPPQVIKRVAGKELERISWDQMVGSGDGQQTGSDRYFFGVAHVDTWSLLVEDNGNFGTTNSRAVPLSRNTTVISNFQGRDGTARLLVLTNGTTRLDFNPQQPDTMTGTDAGWLKPLADLSGFRAAKPLQSTNPAEYRAECMASSFALVERLVGIAMTLQVLRVQTYLLTSVPLAAPPPS